MKKSERDKLLDYYFDDYPISWISKTLGIDKKTIKKKIKSIHTKEGAEKYKAQKREVRKGRPLSEAERKLAKEHAFLVDQKKTAAILCRPVSEIFTKESISMRVDLILAHRYLYYVKNHPIISDELYDKLEREELQFNVPGNELLRTPGSDKAESYPDHIRSLALYLLFKYGRRI